jgi:hypothetical protein
MTTTAKNIVPRKDAEGAQATQYTATNCRTIIDKFTATNHTAGNVTIAVSLVPSGGAAAAANTVLAARAIAPGETYLCPELIGQILEAGGFISTLAGAAASLSISASGREVV